MVRLCHTQCKPPAVYAKKFNLKIHVHHVTLTAASASDVRQVWVNISQGPGTQAMESLLVTRRGYEVPIDLKFTMETDNQRPVRFQVFSGGTGRVKTLENLVGQGLLDPSKVTGRVSINLGHGHGSLDVTLEVVSAMQAAAGAAKGVLLGTWNPTADSTSLFLKRHGDNVILNPEAPMAPMAPRE